MLRRASRVALDEGFTLLERLSSGKHASSSTSTSVAGYFSSVSSPAAVGPPSSLKLSLRRGLHSMKPQHAPSLPLRPALFKGTPQVLTQVINLCMMFTCCTLTRTTKYVVLSPLFPAGGCRRVVLSVYEADFLHRKKATR